MAPATSSAPAASRSHACGSPPAARTSSAWAGLRISDTTASPRACSRRVSRSAIWPCPPAMATRITGRIALTGSSPLDEAPPSSLRASVVPSRGRWCHMATRTRTKASPRLSDSQVAEVLQLLSGADSAELKLTIPDDAQVATVRALSFDPLEAQIRQVFFFDTPDLELNKAGIVV